MASPEPEPGGNRLRDALLVVLGYMAVRALAYRLFPVHSFNDWAIRDAWMTLPRAAAFFSLIALHQRRWRSGIVSPVSDLHLRDWGVAVSLIALCWWDASLAGGPVIPRWDVANGLAATVMVGLFEEYAFRGAILTGLRERMGDREAVLASSLLFAVFHVQAQPLADWPLLFLIGAVLANLRIRGMGLNRLAAVHFLIDAAYFFFGSEGPLRSGVRYAEEAAVLLLLVLLTRPQPAR